MATEYHVELMRDILKSRSFNYEAFSVEVTPAVDMMEAIIKYHRRERDAFELIKVLSRDLLEEKERMKDAIEKKEAAFQAFQSLLPEGQTLNSIHELTNKKS